MVGISARLRTVAGVALLVMALAACKRVKEFEFREARNLHVGKLGLGGMELSMGLVLYNPNNFKVTLKQLDCDVYLNQHLMGKYAFDSTLLIPNLSTFELPVKLKLNFGELMKNSLSVLMNKEALIGFKGHARVGRSGIYVVLPVSHEAKYKVPFL